ncbi:M20/M25/M40 family metallo-hydrolase [Pedobacter sp. KR3-3]|uniref:Carboxypeptidase Q n=1 Tax=Pedobacter albus TaxID=3113905 RepID=A0ABU7I9L3_9SPHI|nr:M20/M25/M40 family metallo-hydrolase [Pedobacter sp. KR3-3]MEE1946150.1 M20/M25/M40 family metallo-hydrolase [Pedobacter sp. KR3-3]
MKNFTMSALALGLCFSAFAQEPVNSAAVQKIRAEGLDKSKAMDIAYHITDVAGPRLSNSPGLKRAQDWALKYFNEIGLKNVHLEAWGEFGKGWQVDKYYAATTLPFYRPIIASPKAWTPGTNGPIKSEVILIKADTVTDLAKYKGKLKGKIIMIESVAIQPLKNSYAPDVVRFNDEALNNIMKPMEPRTGRPGQAGGNNQRAMMLRMMANRAAIDSVLLTEKIGLKLTYARGSYGTFFTSNGASYKLDAKPVSPELEVSSEDYLHILRLLRGGEKVEMEAEVKTSFYDKDPKGYNVIGEIPGTDPKLKDEVVMIGGHYDSWHSGTGATDNAAGSTVMIEAMRILKAIDFKPKRTIRIALWSSEEQGLFGSRGYVKEHFADPTDMVTKPEHAKLSAYYNLDNGTGTIRGVYLQGNAAVKDIFQSWLTPFEDLGAKTITINNTGGTDHQAFDGVGLPGFQFIQDPMDYNTRTHHSNQDVFDRLVEDDLKKSATIVASFVYHTSERAEKLPRKEMPKPQPPRQ